MNRLSIHARLILASIIVAGALVGAAYMIQKENPIFIDAGASSKLDAVIQKLQSGTMNDRYQFTASLGEVGSEHSHMSLAFYVDEKKIDFTGPEYMLQAPHMHFENGDGATIHKHATGLNIPLFLASIYIRINQNCFMLDVTEEFCSNESKQLTVVVNGEKLADIYGYELQDGDRVLINYGNDSDRELMEKFDAIPEPVSAEKR